MSDSKGLARLTKKKELESRIAIKTEEIRTLKAGLSGIVRQHGFATVQDFYTAFYTHGTPLTSIKEAVPSRMKLRRKSHSKSRNHAQKDTKGIKKKLIGRMPVNFIEAEIKGRNNRPPFIKNHFFPPSKWK